MVFHTWQEHQVFSLLGREKGISLSSKDPTTPECFPQDHVLPFPQPPNSWVQTHFSYENSLPSINGLWNQARRFSQPAIPPCSADLLQEPLRVIYEFLISSPNLDPSFALRRCSANVCWRRLSMVREGHTAILLSVFIKIQYHSEPLIYIGKTLRWSRMHKIKSDPPSHKATQSEVGRSLLGHSGHYPSLCDLGKVCHLRDPHSFSIEWEWHTDIHSSFKKMIHQGAEMSALAKFFLYKREALSSIPRTHIKKPGCTGCPL